MKAVGMNQKKTTKKLNPLEIKSFKQNRPPMVLRTKVQKAEARAAAIVKTEQRERNKHFNKQFNDYVARKLLKGYDQKTAEHMARAIYNDK